jgi:membrane protease YdiL (CAAX protease family)
METSNGAGQSMAGSGSLPQLMRKHPLFSYFSIAYAIKFTVLIPYTLAAWSIISGDWTAAFVLATFGPFVAGIIMVNLTERKAGLSRLWKGIWQWRVGCQWLLFVFAGIPALVMLGIIIQPGALVGFQGFTPHILIFLLVSYPLNYVLIWFAGGGLDEEVGWRGFALPIMQTRYGPLWGTLLLGVLHCFWHLEEFLTPAQGGGPGTGWIQFATNLPIFLLFVLSVNLVITWVFNHTRGSLFAVTSLHASVDTPQAALIPLFPALGVTQAGVSTTSMILGFTVGLGLVALLIVILTRGQLGYQPLSSPQSSEP